MDNRNLNGQSWIRPRRTGREWNPKRSPRMVTHICWHKNEILIMSQTLIWLKIDIISPLTCFWIASRTRYYYTLGRATPVTTIFNPFSHTWMKIVFVWGKYSFICQDPPPDEAIPLWVSYCNAFSYIIYIIILRNW